MKEESKPFSWTMEDLQGLESFLSANRFAKYLGKTGGNREKAVRLYAWNTAVSAAFYGPLQALEVTLRSRINTQLTKEYGAEWFIIDKTNMDFLHPNHFERLKNHLKRLERTEERFENKQAPINPLNIIATLPFGFWVSFLTKHYEDKLWRPVLHKAFSHTYSRKKVHQPMDKMRRLRNRIAHHEPIFHLHLGNHYQLILETIGQMSPKKRKWVEIHSRVKEVLAKSPDGSDIRF